MALNAQQQAMGQNPLLTQFNWEKVPGSIAAGGKAWGTQMVKVGTGGATGEDALQSMMSDRNEALQKIAEMEKARREGMGIALQTPQRASDLRDEAKSQRTSLGGKTDEALSRGREGIAGAQAQADLLGPAAEARRAEALQEAMTFRQENLLDAETKKTQALTEFKDDTASAVEMQRTGAMQQFASARDDIINRAAQQGMSPDSPEVQAQLNRAKLGTFQQLGSMAIQGQLAYNDARSKLTATYDDFGLRARAFSDQLAATTRMEEDKYVGLTQQSAAQMSTQLAEMTSSLEMAAVQESRLQEQQTSALLLAADQFELAGSQTIADYMRNYQIAMAPLAPILSLAASINQEALAANATSIAAVSSGAGATTPSSQQLMGGWKFGAGSGQGAGGNTPVTAPNAGTTPGSVATTTPPSTGAGSVTSGGQQLGMGGPYDMQGGGLQFGYGN